jgi:hypothetical protein
MVVPVASVVSVEVVPTVAVGSVVLVAVGSVVEVVVPESVAEPVPAVLVSPVVGVVVGEVVDVVGELPPVEVSALVSEAEPVLVPDSGLQATSSAATSVVDAEREVRPNEFIRPG